MEHNSYALAGKFTICMTRLKFLPLITIGYCSFEETLHHVLAIFRTNETYDILVLSLSEKKCRLNEISVDNEKFYFECFLGVVLDRAAN